MNNAEIFLRSFFRDEIHFLSNKSYQRSKWGNAHGELIFITFYMCFSENWATILEEKKRYSLTESQFNQIQKLSDLVDKFYQEADYPSTPSQYLAILEHPKWNEIHKCAQDVYRTIGSKILQPT